MSNEEKLKKWSGYTARILLSSAAHPFEYAKVLIQIGYEPIPPRRSTTFLGRPALVLPNIFQYVKHIKSVDGFTGCFRGLGSKICGNMVSLIASQKMSDYLEIDRTEECDEETSEDEETEEMRRKKFFKYLKGEVIVHCTAIIISHPFHVITIRMMAQFVGKESKYVGVFGSLLETYKENGLPGFFSGLVPRLLGDVLTLILASSATYAIKKYFVKDKQFQGYASAAMIFLSSSIMYPYQVVSNCMAVSDSGLMAGSPPFMPHYASWFDCWSDLSGKNQLKRGSSLLTRYYIAPKLSIANPAMVSSRTPIQKY